MPVSDPDRQHHEVHAERDVHITGDFVGRDQVTNYGYTSEQVERLLTKLTAEYRPRSFDGHCPYPGLVSFRENDTDVFFGRERLVQILVSRVATAPVTFVIGPSGSGKSSLVQAGLLSSLKNKALIGSAGWRYASLSPGRKPLRALSRALPVMTGLLESGQDLLDHAAGDSTRLARWLQSGTQSAAGMCAVLLVDPLEEIFTQTLEESERRAFLDQLSTAVAQASESFRLVLVMRSDFVSACARYPSLNDLLSAGLTQVGALDPEELVRAVALPALQVGLRIDPDLITAIMADATDEPGALPLLQFALRDLFEAEREPDGVPALTLEGYWRRGGLRQALRRHADSVYTGLTSDEQVVARDILRSLVSMGQADNAPPARRTARLTELPGSPEPTTAVVESLARGRLLTLDNAPAGGDHDLPVEDTGTVTLAHDALLEAWPLLADLVAENREQIRLRATILDDAILWERHGHDTSYLYSGVRLATIVSAVKSHGMQFPEAATRFLEQARQHETDLTIAREAARRSELERERRISKQLRTRNRWITGVSIAASALAIIALMAGVAANRNAQMAANAVETAQVANTQTVAQYQETLVRSAMLQAKQLMIGGTEFSGGREAAVRLAAEAVRIGRAQNPQGIPEANAMLTELLVEGAQLQRFLHFGQTLEGVSEWPDSMHRLDWTHVAFQAGASNGAFAWTVGSDEPTRLSLPSDPRYVVEGSARPDGLWVRDLATGDFFRLGFDGHVETRVSVPTSGALTISPNGAVLLADDPQSLSLWTSSGSNIADLTPETRGAVPIDVRFSPDSSRFMVLLNDGVIVLFDSEGKRLSRFETVGHSLNSDGRWAVDEDLTRIAIAEPSAVQIWESNGSLVTTVPLETSNDSDGTSLPDLAYSPDGALLAIGLLNGHVLLVGGDGRTVHTLTGFQPNVISAMAFNHDGTILGVAGIQSGIRVWQTDGTLLAFLQPPEPMRFFELVLLDGGSVPFGGVVLLARSNHGAVWQIALPHTLDAALGAADMFSMGRLSAEECLQYFGGPCQP